jgi:hypothetical protein
MRFSILGPTTHGPTGGCDVFQVPSKVAKPAVNIAQGRKSTCV